ncbi:hypothetical protein BT96DRAFT_1021880 [Gymnopus androsaceus JB14]|uniref:Uncharacterized protein n=1 Tax=Gymnopus androsaceus JB14 TaxID=1447944 RepID=A0A6A4HEM5_9AGAR|nr:hypothetical protein BT96DRAFT_1021880 [Gymnopus androsaceus JB14]
MSKVVNGRVITVPACNIPKLHTLEPPAILPGYVTQAGSRYQRSSASIAEDMLSIDDGDFLTRRLTLALEKGHLINAVPNDKAMATRVAESLVDVGIVPMALYNSEGFHLEHASNLICIADGLHPLFDTYGVFAYLPSDASMDALLEIVKSRNEALQHTIDTFDPWTSRRSRYLMESIDLDLSTFTYEIAILLPDYFLPFKQELLIRDPTTQDVDLTMPNTSYIRTRVIDKELRIIPTHPDTEPVIHPPFSHSTKRSDLDRVNPFFLCINASDKYGRHCLKYGSGTMSPRVDALFQKAALIVNLVYAVFEPAPNSFGARRKAQVVEQKHERKRQRDEEKEDSRAGGRQTRSRQETGPTVEGSGSEAIEGGESEAFGGGDSERAMDDQRSDFGSDMDETEELKSWIASKERVRLHMLQLFGGKDYETPHMPGVPDPPSVFDRISTGDYNAYERAQ